MALLIKRAIQTYFWVFNDLRDPRTDDFFIISSLPLTIFLGTVYLYFVKIWGPKFMEDRRPYNLDRVIKVYNLLQVVANLYFVVMAFPYFVKADRVCSPVDFSNSPDSVHLLRLLYIYFLIKVIDLLDTVFFVLRKKYNQISFLHVYHHWGMVKTFWIALRFFGGGHTVFLPVLNCIVHTFMYFYYFLTSLDEKYKKNVWWKKHITHLQLIQFVLLIVIYAGPLLSSSCTFPKFPCYFTVLQSFFMLAMFSDFYRKAYLTPPQKMKNNKED